MFETNCFIKSRVQVRTPVADQLHRFLHLETWSFQVIEMKTKPVWKMTVLLLFECLILFPIKEQKPSVRLVHTQKGKREHLWNVTGEMWLIISFVSCQAYLDFYFNKHSEQRLCKEIISRNPHLDFFFCCHILTSEESFSLFHLLIMLIISNECALCCTLLLSPCLLLL